MTKLTDPSIPEMTTTPEPDDLIHIVDKSDTTQSPQGSSKKIKRGLLISNGGYDATVGAVGSGADYNDINTAIAAGKYNLLVIGTFTQPTDVNTGANYIYVYIAERLIFASANMTIGDNTGLKIRGKALHTAYTSGSHILFNGNNTTLLDIDGLTFLDTSSGGTVKLGNVSGGIHIIHNCKFILPNNANCGFHLAGAGSSFTNLGVSGGGSSCKNFIANAEEVIINDIYFEPDTFEDGGVMIQIAPVTKENPKAVAKISTIDNVVCGLGAATMLISVGSPYTQVSNINGSISLDYGANNCNTANCSIKDFIFSGNTDTNYFVNCKSIGNTAITMAGDDSQFVNCNFNAAVTLDVSSSNNQFLLCKSTGGFTDGGTNNSFIEKISEDGTFAANSDRLLSTEKAIKTYADNIAKGITVDYYFSDTPDGVIANYDLMYPADTGQVESNVNTSITAPDTLIASFITQTTEPNFTLLLAGVYDIHIHASKNAVPKDAFIYAKVYKIAMPGGVETLLFTSDNSDSLTTVNTAYTLHSILPDDEVLLITDRLVVKFYGTPTGAGVADPTANLWLEGTNASRIDIHTTSSSRLLKLDNIIFRNGAGNDSNDGKSQGTPKLTVASAILAGIAQTPSASNMVTIKDLGGARISEDVTLPSWMILDMDDAEVIGQVTLGVTMDADSSFYFNKASPVANAACIRISGAGNRYIRGNSTAGALNSTFISASGGAVIYADIVNANAVAAGATFSTLSTGAVLFLKAQTFRETVASTSVGATVFRNVVDDGSNADTTSINETGNHIIRGKDKVSLGTAAVASVVDIEGVGPKWLTAPSFVANLTGDANDVTGDGTTYTVICDNEVADIGGHYNNATGAFTGPTTGLYQFDIVALMKGFTSAHMLSIYLNVAGGTPQNWLLFDVNAANVRTGTPYYIALTGCTTVKLNSGDVVKAHINVRGGASKVVDVLIGTKFAGRLITKI